MSTFNLYPDTTPGGISIPSSLAGVRYYIHSFIGPADRFYDVSTRTFAAVSVNQNRIIGIYKVNTSVSPNIVDPANLINTINIVNITSNIVTADVASGHISFNVHSTYSPSFRIQNLEAGAVYYMYLVTNTNDIGMEVECGLTPFSVINYINTGTILRNLDLYETGDLINSNFPSSQGSQGLYPMGSTLRYYKYTFGPGLSSYDVHITTNSDANTSDRIESIFKDRDGERTNIISSTTITSRITFTGFAIGTGGASGNIITLGNRMTGVRAFTLSGLDSTARYSIILRTTNNVSIGIDVSLALFNPTTSQRITLDYTDVGFLYNGVYMFGSDVINRADEQGNIIHTGSGLILYSWSFTATAPTYDVYMSTSSTAVTIRNINIEPNSNIITNKTATGPRVTNVITLAGLLVGATTITLPTTTQNNIIPFRLTGLLNTVTNVGAGFSPSSIPNLQLWLDGNDPSGNGTTPLNGSTISTWIDKSSNARNATTRIGSITYNSTAKGLRFNGSSSMNVNLTASSNTECVFIVVSVSTVTGDRTLLGASSNSGRQFRISGNNLVTLNQFSTTVLASSYTVPLNTPFLAQFTMDSSLLLHYANGDRTGYSGTGTYTAGRTTIIGGLFQTNTNTDTEFLTGTIHEILVFSSINTFNRQNVEGYLAWKWGFQSRLPFSHPWRDSNQRVENSQKYNIIFEATNNTEAITVSPDLTFGVVDISTGLPPPMQYNKFGYMISTFGEIVYGKDLIPNVTSSNETITTIVDIIRYFRFSFVPTQTSYAIHMATNSSANTNHRIVYIGRANGVNIISTNTTVAGTAPAGFSISGGIITPANNQAPSNGTVFTLSSLVPNETYYIISRTISNSSAADLRIGLMNFNVLHAPLITYESTRSFINGIDMISGIEIFQDNTGLGIGNSRLYRYRFQATRNILDVLISSDSTATTDNDKIVYIGTSNNINLIPTNVSSLSIVATFDNNNTTIALTNTMTGIRTFQLNNLTIGETYYIIFSTFSNSNSNIDARMAIVDQTTKSEVTLTPDGFSFLHNGAALIDGIEVIRDTALDNTTTITTSSFPRFFRYTFTPLSSSCNVLLRTNSSANSDEKIYYIGTDNGIDIIDTNISNIIVGAGLTISNGVITPGARMYGSRAFTLTGLDITKTYYIILSSINNSTTISNTLDAEVRMALIDNTSGQSITLTYDSIGFINKNHLLYNGLELIPEVDSNNFPFFSGASPASPSTDSIYFRYTFTAPAAAQGNTTSSCDVFLSTSASSSGREIIYSIFKTGETNIIKTDLASSTQITNFISATGFTVSAGRITVGNSMPGLITFTLTGLDPGEIYNIIVRSTNNSTIFDLRCALINPVTDIEIALNYNSVGYFALNDTIIFGSDLCPNRDPTNTVALATGSNTTRFYIFSFKPVTTVYSLYLTSTYISEEGILSIYTATSPINIINTTNIKNLSSNITIPSNIITPTVSAFNEIRVCTIENLIPNTDYFWIVRTTYNDTYLDLAGGLIDLTAIPPAPIALTYVSTSTTLTTPGQPSS